MAETAETDNKHHICDEQIHFSKVVDVYKVNDRKSWMFNKKCGGLGGAPPPSKGPVIVRVIIHVVLVGRGEYRLKQHG